MKTVYKLIHEARVVATSDTPIYVEGGHYRSAGKVWLSLGPENAQVVIEEQPEPTQRRITTLAFRQRFSIAEKAAIVLGSRGNAPANAMLQAYMDDVMAASYIDLDREDTRAGVQALADAGVITQERVAQILDAEIQPQEIPH